MDNANQTAGKLASSFTSAAFKQRIASLERLPARSLNFAPHEPDMED